MESVELDTTNFMDAGFVDVRYVCAESAFCEQKYKKISGCRPVSPYFLQDWGLRMDFYAIPDFGSNLSDICLPSADRRETSADRPYISGEGALVVQAPCLLLASRFEVTRHWERSHPACLNDNSRSLPALPVVTRHDVSCKSCVCNMIALYIYAYSSFAS